MQPHRQRHARAGPNSADARSGEPDYHAVAARPQSWPARWMTITTTDPPCRCASEIPVQGPKTAFSDTHPRVVLETVPRASRKSGAIGLTRGTGTGYIQVICYLPLWGGNEGPRGPSFLLEVICGPFRCVRGRRLPLRRGWQALLPHPEAGVAPSGRHGGQPAHSAPGTEGLQPPSAPNLLVRRGEEWHPDQGAAADSRAPEREAPARPAQYKEPAERR